jgi:hypothetical protein
MRIAIHKVGKHAKLEDSSSHQTSLVTTNPAVHDVSGGRDAALLCHNLPIENSPAFWQDSYQVDWTGRLPERIFSVKTGIG